MKLASKTDRVVAGILDLLFLLVMTIPYGMITGETSFEGGLRTDITGWSFLVFFLLIIVLFTVMEKKLGKTPGKFAVHIQVVSVDGQPIAWKQAILRNTLRLVDGIGAYLVGFIIMFTNKENQRLGDIVAKTHVVTQAQER